MNTQAYTKYPQFRELAENIHNKGPRFLADLIPEEKPTDPIKLKQCLTMLMIVLGLAHFNRSNLRDVVMFVLDIDTVEEVDYYVTMFANELDAREKAA